MAGIRVVFNRGQFNAIRNSAEVVGLMEDLAGQIKARADSNNRFHDDDGEAFTVNTVHNTSRAVTFINTHNIDGRLAEAVDRALTKAIG